MKQELEKLRTELNERIDLVIKNYLTTETPKPEFTIGKWYCNYDTFKKAGRFKCLFNLTKIKSNHYYGFGFTEDDFVGGSDFTSSPENYRPATESEIKEALIKEAEKRGYKKGVKIKTLFDSASVKYPVISGNTLSYYLIDDSLYFPYGCVYLAGKWATIVKEEAIKIGGYEVKFFKNDPNEYYTKIDGHEFSLQFWLSAKEISEHSKAKVCVGCSKQFDVSLETINAILEKLK